MDTTTALSRHVTELTDRRLEADLTRSDTPGSAAIGPRQRMVMIMNAAGCWLNPTSGRHGRPGVLDAALDWTAQLAAAQTNSGLFSIGGNMDSAPDTAFVINDAAATVLLLRECDALPQLRRALTEVIDRSAPGLIDGGVHTPNHRWEVAAALGRIDAVRPNPAARTRAEQWLAEGIDIDADGLYSERSVNYAAYVSNPSLLALSELLDRPDLAGTVHRNLHAQVDLTGPDGIVETVFSRRQDQKLPIPAAGSFGLELGIFLLHYRHFATSCAACAATYAGLAERELAASEPVADPTTVLIHLLSPTDSEPAEGPTDPSTDPGTSTRSAARVRVFSSARVAVVHDQQSMITLNAGSDVPAVGRVASGLACNPTFLRWRSTEPALDSVRLSRNFFGLGPFRPQQLHRLADHSFRLDETVSAGYYQPLPADLRDDRGSYDLQFEGRFAAQLAFTDRPHTDLTLVTQVDVEIGTGRITLRIHGDGPSTRQCLELGFRPGGTMINAEPLGDDRWLYSPGTVYRAGTTQIAIDSDAPVGQAADALYQPGEAYEFLGGTDAVGGPRLYLPVRTPGSVEVALTRGLSGDTND